MQFYSTQNGRSNDNLFVIFLPNVLCLSVPLTCGDPDGVADPADRQLGAEHRLPAAVEHAGLRPGPHQQARSRAEVT